MSFSETVFLFFLALIIFGPKKLPEIARQVGRYLNEFKRASNEFKAQIEQEIAHLEVESKEVENKRVEDKHTILPPSAAPEGTASRSLSPASVEATPADASATPAPETQAASTDEPVAGPNRAEPLAAAEALPAPDAVTPITSQESHA